MSDKVLARRRQALTPSWQHPLTAHFPATVHNHPQIPTRMRGARPPASSSRAPLARGGAPSISPK
ncbi:hypothetical protein BGLA2_460028 [Burkholderia gladioli]|nr:hypothetical protein BGLA2_460028 [Burkholderia gladioli]